ncbi:hypothetical protein SCALM49S_05285 [Streptomyces californicus]
MGLGDNALTVTVRDDGTNTRADTGTTRLAHPPNRRRRGR